MLKIYRDKKDWPEDTLVNIDVEFAKYCPLSNTYATHFILEKVDHAKRLDDRSFLDRFNFKLYRDCISTGSKALLLAVQTGLPVCFNECGDNALGVAIMLSDRYDMRICYSRSLYDCEPLIDEDVNIVVDVDGTIITDIEDIFMGGLSDGCKLPGCNC